jgi:Ras family protein A
VTPEHGMNAKYMECSAKEQKGVAEVFQVAINTAVHVEESSYETKNTTQGNKKVKKAKKSRCKFL